MDSGPATYLLSDLESIIRKKSDTLRYLDYVAEIGGLGIVKECNNAPC